MDQWHSPRLAHVFRPGHRRHLGRGRGTDWISSDLALAHIAGIFHAQRKHQPDVGIIVSPSDGAAVMRRVGNSALDLGILTAPAALPENVVVTHRMADQFSIVVPSATETAGALKSIVRFRKWADSQNWLLPPDKSRSRQQIDDWARENRMDLQPVMELENFDLMMQFLSMGMGAALIPRRCFGTFRRKPLVRMIAPPMELSRRLIVISPNTENVRSM
jgi:DNA-binding transcriptional LysR family regulator